MSTVLHHTETPAPVERREVYGHPHAAVKKVDAIVCSAPAMHDIGGKRTCDGHYQETLRAYWETDASRHLHHYLEPRGICGELVR